MPQPVAEIHLRHDEVADVLDLQGDRFVLPMIPGPDHFQDLPLHLAVLRAGQGMIRAETLDRSSEAVQVVCVGLVLADDRFRVVAEVEFPDPFEHVALHEPV